MYNDDYTNMRSDQQKQLMAIGLSQSETSVYLALVDGAQTAAAILKTTGQKRPTVYYALGCLARRGLIARSGSEGIQRFVLAPTKRLTEIAQEHVASAERIARDIGESLPLFTPATDAVPGKPAVAFFEGKEAAARAVMDMMYAKRKSIDVLAPNDNFFHQMGSEFVERFVGERKRRGIKTRSLWESPIAGTTMKKYYEDSSEVRILPSHMRGTFKTSIFLFDDLSNVAHFGHLTPFI